MSEISQVQPDWARLYSSSMLQQWQLPAASHAAPKEGTFRQPLVKWSELPRRAADGQETPMWLVCCDVLVLDENVVLDRAALIFARRIELAGRASVTIGRMEPDSPELLIFAQEVVARESGKPAALTINVVRPGLDGEPAVISHDVQPDPVAAGATGLRWAQEALQPEPMAPTQLDPAFLIEGEPLRLALMTTFQLAVLLSTEQFALSVAQLRWVASLAQASPDTRDLAMQAGAMASSQLAAHAAGANALLVPQLDNSIYAAEAVACLDLLKLRQQHWENLRARQDNDQQWADAVRASLAEQQNQKQLALKLEQQAEESRWQVLAARDIAAKQVVTSQALLRQRELDFELGIRRWKEKETDQARIDLAMSIFKVLQQVPAVVAAGPEFSALPAIETVASVGTTIVAFIGASPPSREKPADIKADAETKKSREQLQENLVSGAKGAAEGAKGIYDAAIKINQIAAMAEQMEANSRNILDQINKTVDSAMASFDVQGLDMVTGGAQEWDLLAVAIEDAFDLEGGLLKRIAGGPEYRLEFRRLIIHGKSLSQARLAMAKANAQLAELIQRRIVAEQSVAIAERRLGQLSEQLRNDATLAQLAFGKVLDAKRSIYMAMEAYHRAFQYFTLLDAQQAPALPRITASVDAFAEAVKTISGKLLTHSSLVQPPQTMNEVVFTLDDPALLQVLRASGGFVTWALAADAPAFHGFGRVRFTRVQVFAEGVTTPNDLEVQIVTSGVYTDKKPHGGTRRFVGEPVQVRFVYSGGDKTIKFDGDIARRYEDDFFNPTPFTTWTLRILCRHGGALDLAAITSLKIQFYGEATSIRER